MTEAEIVGSGMLLPQSVEQELQWEKLSSGEVPTREAQRAEGLLAVDII